MMNRPSVTALSLRLSSFCMQCFKFIKEILKSVMCEVVCWQLEIFTVHKVLQLICFFF